MVWRRYRESVNAGASYLRTCATTPPDPSAPPYRLGSSRHRTEYDRGVWFAIHECFYDGNGLLTCWTAKPVTIAAEDEFPPILSRLLRRPGALLRARARDTGRDAVLPARRQRGDGTGQPSCR
jgi:hypothetical protein